MKDEKKAFEDFLEFFADKLSGADVIAARELGKISAIIAKERIDRGLNQKDFAKLLNVSQSMESKWESENYNFTIENLANICDKLDLELEVNITNPTKQYKKEYMNLLQYNFGSWNSNGKNRLGLQEAI